MKEIFIKGFLKTPFILMYSPEEPMDGESWLAFRIKEKDKILLKSEASLKRFVKTDFTLDELENFIVSETVYNSSIRLFEFENKKELDEYLLKIDILEELTK